MMRLAAILDEIGGAVFYDLMAHVGFDLQGWFAGGCRSHRPCHIFALIDGLPRTTATQAYLLRDVRNSGGSGGLSDEDKRFFDAVGWSDSDKILAMIHNQLAAANHARKEGDAPLTPESMGFIGPFEWRDGWERKKRPAGSGLSELGVEAPAAGESINEAMSRLMGGLM